MYGLKTNGMGGIIGEYKYDQTISESGKTFIASPEIDIGKRQLNYRILWGPVFSGDTVDPKYILEDNSGLYIPITKERINVILEHSVGLADGTSPDFRKTLLKAKKLIDISGTDMEYELCKATEKAEKLYKNHPKKRAQMLREKSVFDGEPAYSIELGGRLTKSWKNGVDEYSGGHYSTMRALGRRNAGTINEDIFPYSLQRISTQSIAELMKHFASEGFDFDYMQKHMKIERIDD